MQVLDLVREGERLMTICNACRYCEGYCAVFPAMERRIAFGPGDLRYLANLCHQCGECYSACQYAPPHEFAVNVPQTMAKLRRASYAEYAWPAPLARAYAHSGLLTALLLAVLVGLAIWWGATGTVADGRPGDFYRVIPHAKMAALFGLAGGFALLAIAIGCVRFWRDAGEDDGWLGEPRALGEALRDVLTLRYLHGHGCAHPDGATAAARKWMHHLTFYGFLLCFAATSVATLMHYGLGLPAPYAYDSLPVALGTLGGIGLLIGPLGLAWLRRRRDSALGDPAQQGMDVALIALLVLTSASGLALLAVRETPAMPVTLVVHLAIVLTLFLTLPYGKFVHGLYRAAALLKYARERRRPGLQLGGE